MTKEGFIDNIHNKLNNGIQLDNKEITTIIAALRESSHCYQEPYYEVVYHDKYGNQECRIMNPDNRSFKKEIIGSANLYMVEDSFSVNFRRFAHEEDL